MLTLDEAIKHCLEVAKEQTYQADAADAVAILDGLDVDACRQCANDHKQLAIWLQERKELRSDAEKLRDIILQIYSETSVASFGDAYTTIGAINRVLDSSSTIWNKCPDEDNNGCDDMTKLVVLTSEEIDILKEYLRADICAEFGCRDVSPDVDCDTCRLTKTANRILEKLG